MAGVDTTCRWKGRGEGAFARVFADMEHAMFHVKHPHGMETTGEFDRRRTSE